MQATLRARRCYWATPAAGLVIGLLYLTAFAVGGKLLDGLLAFAVMAVFSAGVALAGRRSETIRGPLGRRDERINGIDLRATAVTAVVMILAVLTGFLVEVARGHSGTPYVLIGTAGGIAYVAAVGYYRIRG